MKVIGKMICNMVKELKNGQIRVNTQVNICQEVNMESDLIFGLKKVLIKENGKKTK